MRKLIAGSLIMLSTACSPAGSNKASEPAVASPAVAAQKKGDITNYETEGNLAAASPTDCVEVSQLTDDHTPADIYPGISDCLSKGDVDRAAKLSALAYVYGYYDRLRVADRSAHQATQVLQLNHLSTAEKDVAQKMFERVDAISEDDAALGALCDDIMSLGRPSYYPAYMIQHGIKAFSGGSGDNGIVAGFSAEEAWREALDRGLHCSI